MTLLLSRVLKVTVHGCGLDLEADETLLMLPLTIVE